MQSSIKIERGEAEAIAYWETDIEYLNDIKSMMQNSKKEQIATSIGEFQMLSLQYEIDITKYQIDWFTNLKEKIVKKE